MVGSIKRPTNREGKIHEIKPKEVLASERWCSDSYGVDK
jgi:hypothetical protein